MKYPIRKQKGASIVQPSPSNPSRSFNAEPRGVHVERTSVSLKPISYISKSSPPSTRSTSSSTPSYASLSSGKQSSSYHMKRSSTVDNSDRKPDSCKLKKNRGKRPQLFPKHTVPNPSHNPSRQPRQTQLNSPRPDIFDVPPPPLPLSVNANEIPPWLLSRTCAARALDRGDIWAEVMDLVTASTLTSYEVSLRHRALRILRDTLNDVVYESSRRSDSPSSTNYFTLNTSSSSCNTIQTYGSYSTGLFVPSSDLNVMLIMANSVENNASHIAKRDAPMKEMKTAKAQNPNAILYQLAARLNKGNEFQGVHVDIISETRPQISSLLKCRFIVEHDNNEKMIMPTEISIDVSTTSNHHHPYLSDTTNLRKLAQAYPHARALYVVAKLLLRQYGYDGESIGGLSSTTLFFLCVSHIQNLQTNFGRDATNHGETADLLTSFFYLYGIAFPFQKIGISVGGKGGMYYERRRHLAHRNTLSIMMDLTVDPKMQIVDHEISCPKLHEIRKLFANVARILRNWTPDSRDVATTPLASVLHITRDMRKRRQHVVMEQQRHMCGTRVIVNLEDIFGFVNAVRPTKSHNRQQNRGSLTDLPVLCTRAIGDSKDHKNRNLPTECSRSSTNEQRNNAQEYHQYTKDMPKTVNTSEQVRGTNRNARDIPKQPVHRHVRHDDRQLPTLDNTRRRFDATF